MKGFVIGLGWVTAAGIGQGRRGDRFAFGSGDLPVPVRRELFAAPYPRFGRLDDFSRLGLAGIALALADAGFDRWTDKRPVGLCAATTCGCLATDFSYFDTVVAEGGALASPNLFAYTLANTFVGEAAIRFGLTGPALVVNAAADDPFCGLRIGLEALLDGDCPLVVAGICDLVPPPPLALPGQGAGALFLVLAGAEAVTLPPYGELSWATPAAVEMGGTPVRDWEALAAACSAQLPPSGRRPAPPADRKTD